MPTVKAKLVKGVPACPQCGYQYAGEWENYGYDEGIEGYWYIFVCPNCTTKTKKGDVKSRCLVKYYSDSNFKIIQRRSTP